MTHVDLPQNTQVCLVKTITTITTTTTTKDNLCSSAMGEKKITPGRGSAGCRHNASDSCTIDGHRETAFCFARGKSLNVTDRLAVALDPPHLANPPPSPIPLSNNDTGQPIAFSHCFIFQPSSLVAVDENFHVKISAKLLTAHGEMFKCDFTQN